MIIRQRNRDRFYSSELGASLVEYALLILLVMLVAIVAVRFFGASVSTSFSSSTSAMFSGS